ncbi:MAG TPA: hypothetical protein VFZ77_06905 [Acidimicrobiales bacterium]
MPLGRRVSGTLLGGVAAAGAVCALDTWLFGGSDWSPGRLGFSAVWCAVMFPVLLWVGARR